MRTPSKSNPKARSSAPSRSWTRSRRLRKSRAASRISRRSPSCRSACPANTTGPCSRNARTELWTTLIRARDLEPELDHLLWPRSGAAPPCRRVLLSGIASDASCPQHRAPGPGQEAGLDEQRHRLAFGDRLAVEALDREALPGAAAADVLDERGQRRPQPRFVGIAKRDERAAAALHEQGRHAADHHDLSAGDPGRSRPVPLRPGQHGSVGLRGVSGTEHERLRFVVLARPELTQAFDGASEGELGAAEAFDEVTAPAETERLERLQLAVHRAVAAGDAFGADA